MDYLFLGKPVATCKSVTSAHHENCNDAFGYNNRNRFCRFGQRYAWKPLGLRSFSGASVLFGELELNREERLAVLMQSVGFALWQMQEVETTLATYLVLRVYAYPGIGVAGGDALLKQAEGRTLGSLLTELAKLGIITDPLLSDLREMLKQRNWLVHRARRETRGILADVEQFEKILRQLESLADRALQLLKSLAIEVESYVLTSGVERASIDVEADRLARNWGIIE
jgi:hypothetical protein